jgi:hypothetical protein
MCSPVTAWLIALSSSAARPDHVGQGVNVTGQQGLPIEGVMARAAITYTLFKTDLTRCVAYRLSIVHWIMTALQPKP